MNCPRCKTPIGPLPDPDSIITCPGCGTRLMTRSAARRSQGGPKPADAEAPPAPPEPTPSAPGPEESPPASEPDDFPPPPPVEGSPLDTKPAVAPPAAPAGPDADDEDEVGARAPNAGIERALELLLGELRAIREAQELILRRIDELREARASSPGEPGDFTGFAGADAPAFSPIRDGQPRSVLLVDDDPQTREAAVAEFRRAEVPVRAFDDGNAALSAIAERRPDVIVLELGLGGDMGGKDLINLVKATMEWVDIPIVLWTREAVSSQKEARQIHGADESVPKSSGPAALVARVINVFRR